MGRSRELAELASAYDGGSLGFRNRIINGDMRIDQRNAGASVTVLTTTGYTLDRWTTAVDASSKFSVQQVADAPTGFSYSLKATSLSAYTPGAGEEFRVGHIVEGYNFADMAFGSASAKAFTLTFWVKSSLTGTFGVFLANADNSRTFVSTYTVNSANTWEQKTIAVSGDTAGAWLTTNGRGVQVFFELAAGSNYFTSTTNAWASSSGVRTTSAQTQLVATNAATWQVTGVQLEAGSVATPFERRPYGTELALCQRYYYRTDATSSGPLFTYGFATGTTASDHVLQLLVPMRSSPTIGFNSVNVSTPSGSPFGVTAMTMISPTANFMRIVTTTSGLTTGNPYFLRAATTGYIDFSAEL